MNKLKQLFSTFKTKWNDKSLYKTSLIKKGYMFQLNTYLLALTVSALFTVWWDAELTLWLILVSYNLNLINTSIYKKIVDNVEDTKVEEKQ